jgi:thiol-disulfide isomerase/thioredoxin
MNRRLFYLMAIILLLIASVFIAKKLKKRYAPSINLSGITLTDLNGSTVNMAGFTGKPLIINFWGSWCGPCRAELPVFEKAKEKNGSQINFVMVSDEPFDKIIKFKAENNYTFFYAQSQKRFKELGLNSVPITYFYDAKGRLIAKKKDTMNEEELNAFIAEVVNKQ